MKENLFEMYARMCKSYSRCKMGCPMYKMLPGRFPRVCGGDPITWLEETDPE